jgi:hypothetical protein
MWLTWLRCNVTLSIWPRRTWPSTLARHICTLNDENRIAHLWVVATEPNDEGQFATVSFTSLKGAKDQTVVLRRAEHPFIKWDTCVLYALAEITTTDRLQAHLDSGRARMRQDLPSGLLRLILDGFNASEYTKNRVRNFVAEYRRNVLST